MARTRIIIADTDDEYVIPLQLKLVEEYFEKVDIEIITDRNYFNALFSTPQKVEILIISEDLYDSTLQRHNIKNTFLMTEQFGDEQTGDLNVNRIFKYTSIKEILNEITGKCSTDLDGIVGAKKETQIVLVYSACGGVGKTTVALGVAVCLTRSYKRVLYINAERLHSFQGMLENQSAISAADVYSKLTSPKETIYNDIKHVIRQEQFAYLPPFKASLMSLGLSYAVYKKIAFGAKKSGDYDYIVIDADSAFDDDKANLINIADRVVVVLKQNKASVYSTNLLVSNITGVNSEKYVFVCNDFNKELDNALISPTLTPHFSVNEYIDHFAHYDQAKCAELAKDTGIQKIAYLIM